MTASLSRNLALEGAVATIVIQSSQETEEIEPKRCSGANHVNNVSGYLTCWFFAYGGYTMLSYACEKT
jgi:hypothetical protein